MNVTLLNGALPGDPFTDALAQRLADEYVEQGAQVTAWRLCDVDAAYCLGCFQCWTHTPGRCRIDDEMQDVTASVIHSDVLVIVSPVTFGGYSSPIKKALDRSICLVSPFFTRIDGEVHHRRRYARFPRIRALGVLASPDADQEAIFDWLVRRNAINMHAPAHTVEFVYQSAHRSGPAAPVPAPTAAENTVPTEAPGRAPGAHALLLVGSAKPPGSSTSESLGRYLCAQMCSEGWDTRTLYVHQALRTEARTRAMLDAVDAADLVILASPLYVDSLPYLATAALERIAAHRARVPASGAHRPRFVGLINCGFPEAKHNFVALGICEQFARSAGLAWAGGLGMGSGGVVAGAPLESVGPAGDARRALELTAAALTGGESVPDEAVSLLSKSAVPPQLYTRLVHLGWLRTAWRQGSILHLNDRTLMR